MLFILLGVVVVIFLVIGCSLFVEKVMVMLIEKLNEVIVVDIFGDLVYWAIFYGGYCVNSWEVQFIIVQLKEDMFLLQVMGIKVLRIYNIYLV